MTHMRVGNFFKDQMTKCSCPSCLHSNIPGKVLSQDFKGHGTCFHPNQSIPYLCICKKLQKQRWIFDFIRLKISTKNIIHRLGQRLICCLAVPKSRKKFVKVVCMYIVHLILKSCPSDKDITETSRCFSSKFLSGYASVLRPFSSLFFFKNFLFLYITPKNFTNATKYVQIYNVHLKIEYWNMNSSNTLGNCCFQFGRREGSNPTLNREVFGCL